MTAEQPWPDELRETVAKTVLPIADSFAKDPDAVSLRWADEILSALAASPYAVVRRDEYEALRDEVEGMAWQFGYRGVKDGKRVLHTGGLSNLESAFPLLGWDDPYFVLDDEAGGCSYPGCPQWSHIGTGTKWGYRWFCSREHQEAYAGPEPGGSDE